MNMDFLVDDSIRRENGVKVRADGKGDPWAAAHREGLGNKYFMQDVDALFGAMCFGHNTGEKLFLEYVPDDYKNRLSAIRRFGVVALFDRKSSESHAFSSMSLLSRGLYLYICCVLASAQGGITPKFFYVIGKDDPPWKMIELDIHTGERTGFEEIINMRPGDPFEWQRVYGALGLQDIRDQVQGFMNRLAA